LDLDNVDTRHHAVVFVFEVVAVKQVAPTEAIPTHNHVDLLSGSDRYSVFPSALLTTWRAAIAMKNLKWNEMGVDRVEHVESQEALLKNRQISISPSFGSASTRSGSNSLPLMSQRTFGGKPQLGSASKMNVLVRVAWDASRGSISDNACGTMLSSRSERTTSKIVANRGRVRLRDWQVVAASRLRGNDNCTRTLSGVRPFILTSPAGASDGSSSYLQSVAIGRARDAANPSTTPNGGLADGTTLLLAAVSTVACQSG
jgi:hypothetical protein